jgi:hypothetical protein
LYFAPPVRKSRRVVDADPGSRAAGWQEIGTSSRGEAIFHGTL